MAVNSGENPTVASPVPAEQIPMASQECARNQRRNQDRRRYHRAERIARDARDGSGKIGRGLFACASRKLTQAASPPARSVR